jgi:hypothetical protein
LPFTGIRLGLIALIAVAVAALGMALRATSRP